MLDRNVQHLLRRLCQALDTPRSLTVWLLVKNQEWAQLVSLKVEPAGYEPFFHLGIDRLRRDTLATEFLRKCEGLPTGVDLRAEALAAFYQAERQCFDTNVRLDRFFSYPVATTALEKAADRIVDRARSWIARTLGDLPQRLDGRFGPGATFESADWKHRKTMVAYDKLRNLPSCTPRCSEWADHLVWQTVLGRSWGALAPGRLIPVVRGNRFTTVPKDATKDRGICIEPGLNVRAQLALGAEIRTRLKRRGLDLLGGQDWHRRMAMEASLDSNFCTIDLSSASDTIAKRLVKLLLPDDWYHLLSEFRSPLTRHQALKPSIAKKLLGARYNPNIDYGEWVLLEKFSSMGNGYTFELETLIFASLLHGVGCEIGLDTWVYGDDIICPSDRAADALACLRYFGFTPNPKKTFTTGYFRESCGGDYFYGHDVRGFYLKELPSEPSDWITIANALYKRALEWGIPSLIGVRGYVMDQIPSHIRACKGPEELGDLVIWEHDTSRWCATIRSGIRWIRVWRPIARKIPLRHRRIRVGEDCRSPLRPRKWLEEFVEQEVALASAVLGLPSDGLSPRDGVTGYRIGRVAFS